jgi:hypothetical protein
LLVPKKDCLIQITFNTVEASDREHVKKIANDFVEHLFSEQKDKLWKAPWLWLSDWIYGLFILVPMFTYIGFRRIRRKI